MGTAKRSRIPVVLASVLLLLLTLNAASRAASVAAPPLPATAVAQQAAAPCPGQESGVLATGTYRNEPVEGIVINGQPWGGANWAPGERSYWHCHEGGQLMMLWEGEGRVQRRGERMQILSVRETHVVGPGEEHWHGASLHSHGHFVQASFQPGRTYWMEEVSRDDYSGNDIGIASRAEFLRTGVREQRNP